MPMFQDVTTKVLYFLMGLCGFSLGSWGIYESTRTVEYKAKRIDGKILVGEDEEKWLEIIRTNRVEENFKKFVEKETIPVDTIDIIPQLKKKCLESAAIRRWNWSYSKHYSNFLSYCTKDQTPASGA